MIPHLLKIPLKRDHSFNVRYDIVPHFYDQWHYHDEIELVYIIKGAGMQFVGDSIHHFAAGDMILLGANLPHLWRSDAKFLAKDATEKVEAIVIHFRFDCFGAQFFNLPENRAIMQLLESSKHAVRVPDELVKKLAPELQMLLKAEGGSRIILLLSVLQKIASGKGITTICNAAVAFEYRTSETDRLNTIYQHILDNYSREITLEEIASVAHLSTHAFCRYFKLRVKKTYSRFLTEVRIGHACRLLAETTKTVAEVCFECGFNNFSNFNRHFKTITGKTPLSYPNSAFTSFSF